MRNDRKWLQWLAAMAAGSILTVSVSYAFNLYTFQSGFYKAYRVYDTLLLKYIRELPQEQLVEGAISGMLLTLDDPYSTYLPANQTTEFDEQTKNQFEGIGADIRVSGGNVVVVSPVHGTPAEQAGLLPNDIIVEADGTPLAGLSLEEAAVHIRGPRGSEVTLTIRRSGIPGEFPVTIKRTTIPTETVKLEELRSGAVHIRITDFGATTSEEFAKIADSDEVAEAQGIVLDLRQNPGGYIKEAARIAGYFLPSEQALTTSVARDGTAEPIFIEGDGVRIQVPVVVLIDEGSASASEILALALKETAGIPLIGKRTFGKGIGQEVEYFQDGSIFTYTFAEAVTPAGTRYHEVGVEPDIVVELPDYMRLPALTGTQEFEAGDSASEIGYAQQYLQALGFDPKRNDGVFDESTRSAVLKFQRSAALAASGRLDRDTVSAMVERLRARSEHNDTQLARAVQALDRLDQDLTP